MKVMKAGFIILGVVSTAVYLVAYIILVVTTMQVLYAKAVGSEAISTANLWWLIGGTLAFSLVNLVLAELAMEED